LANLSGIVEQLKKERDRVQYQLSGLNAALEAFAGICRPTLAHSLSMISPVNVLLSFAPKLKVARTLASLSFA
jgi:hypothetical protein